MCVGIPMKLVEVRGEVGLVEEAGVRREVGLNLLEAPTVGQYVIVHAGYAIQLLDPEEAQETLQLLREAGLVDEQGGLVPPERLGGSQ
jgi:hydrogenase expression/formation protein HypC